MGREAGSEGWTRGVDTHQLVELVLVISSRACTVVDLEIPRLLT